VAHWIDRRWKADPSRDLFTVSFSGYRAEMLDAEISGIYRRARTGKIRHVASTDDTHEPPARPEVECRTDGETKDEWTARVAAAVERSLS
jgi:adenylylsulfate kinase-like enzyme